VPDELSLVPGRLAVLAGGREVLLTRTQYRILAVLLGEPGRVFSRAELVELGIGSVVGERTVDVHLTEARRKLGRHRWLVEAVRGQGYRYAWPPA
jgi:two-component system phosphate regulon response regulator PhoB